VLHVVLYGCETWFLTLRVEHGPRVAEKGVLRNVLFPKGANEQEAGKIHNEEQQDVFL
jgi:hypothetical protein